MQLPTTRVEDSLCHEPDRARWNMGCGFLNPLRLTRLAAVFSYEYEADQPTRVDDKMFCGNIINVTVGGEWTFNSRSGRHVLDDDTVMIGRDGETYSCAHDHRYPNHNLIACLAQDAVDPEEDVLFDRDVLRGLNIEGQLIRAIDLPSDDQFDTVIFEIFDQVWKLSLGATRYRKGRSLRMQRLKRFIEHHAFEPIGLSEMAAATGLSLFATVRQFRDAVGLTPHAYLANCRAEEATRLLTSSQLTVEEVAARVGIPDPAYFSRFFKRLRGVTPSAYRRENAR